MWRRLRRLLADRAQRKDPLVEFEDGLLLIIDPEQLTNNLQGKLRQLMDVKRAAVYLADPGTDGPAGGFCLVSPAHEDGREGLSDIAAGSRIAEWFRVNREILVFDRSDAVTQYLGDELQPFLDQGMALAFPLISMDRLIGLVFLSLGRMPLDRFQLANLRMLSRQAGLAFENALLFKERLRQNERMYRAEQLATMGQFAAGIAHELRNPLTAIRSTVQFLTDEFAEGSEPRKLANTILDEVDRLNGIVGNLLTFARPAESHPVPVDLREEIGRCTAFIEARAQSQGVQMEIVCSEGLPRILIDPTELRQVLLNILMNGLQAMPEGGTLSIEARRMDRPMPSVGRTRGHVLVEISDRGPGVPAALREKVFEPFFTTKTEGTGLGLPICRSIVRHYDGDIWIDGTAAGGTCVKVLLACE